MKKTILAIVVAIAAVSAAMLCLLDQKEIKTIAIVTTLSHPALDNVRTGFVNVMNESLGKAITLSFYNAEGDMQEANLIGQKISSDKTVIGILTIGSLATMAITKAEKKRPIVFAAVTDPKILGDLSDNVCGLTDAISPDYQIDIIRKIVPSIQRIAILYTPSEANSSSMVQGLGDVLKAKGIPSHIVGIHEPQQIMTASASACKNADAIIIPLDNQLVASMPAVIKATRSLPCLVIASNESPIHQGAALAFGVDYMKSGEDAGRMMTGLISHNTHPSAIAIGDKMTIDLFVNIHVVDEKAVTLDTSSLPNIITVAGDIHG